MAKQKINTSREAIPFKETKHTPARVALRLEGVVKNSGIKEQKKAPKGNK